MFTHSLDSHRYTGIIALALVLLTTHSYGGDDLNQAPPPTPSTIQTDKSPAPVEQALVPEGIFASRLIKALKLGSISEIPEAEKLLSTIGIEPKNGWISEYPMTPVVLGEIETAITSAREQKKLALTQEQIQKAVGQLKAELGLAITTGVNSSGSRIPRGKNTIIYSYVDIDGISHYTDVYNSIPAQYRDTAKKISQLTPHEVPPSSSQAPAKINSSETQNRPELSPQIINNYYSEQGPPAITYYAPPEPYYYLYTWVSYPFWSSGFHFPGYFVLNDFHRHVIFNQQPYFVSQHNDTHHFSQRQDIDAVQHQHLNQELPERPGYPRWFTNQNAQNSASSIATFSQNRHVQNNTNLTPIPETHRQPFATEENTGNSGYENSQIFSQPQQNQPIYNPTAMMRHYPTEHLIEQGRIVINTPNTFGGEDSNRIFGRGYENVHIHEGGSFGGGRHR